MSNGALIERKGRCASFLGCINYPKCKFSKKIKINSIIESADHI